MAATAVIDIIENTRWIEKDNRVTEIRRGVLCHDLIDESGTSTNVITRAANLPGIPQPGEVHPNINTLFVRDRTFNAIAPGIVAGEITYRRRDDGIDEPPPGFTWQVRGGSQTEQIESETDRYGDPIILEHNGVQQGGVINVDEARSVLQFTTEFQSDNIGGHSQVWTNTTNDATWNAGAAGTWRCMSIGFDYIPVEGAATPWWRVAYDFAYKPTGWDPTIVYTDPNTGKPPANIDIAGPAVKTVEWYSQRNFAILFPP